MRLAHGVTDVMRQSRLPLSIIPLKAKEKSIMLEAILILSGLVLLIIFFYPRSKWKKPDVASTRNGRRRGE